MAKFHEDHIGKAQKITGYVLSILFSFQILMAGVLKVVGEDAIVERAGAINYYL
jgi:hypothetical protein